MVESAGCGRNNDILPILLILVLCLCLCGGGFGGFCKY